jgi:hypothetical protein
MLKIDLFIEQNSISTTSSEELSRRSLSSCFLFVSFPPAAAVE